MKLLFKFMSFVSLNRFYFNRDEAKIPQEKHKTQKKTNPARNKKAKQKCLAFLLALMTYQFAKRTLTAFSPFFPSLSSKVTASFS